MAIERKMDLEQFLTGILKRYGNIGNDKTEAKNTKKKAFVDQYWNEKL